MRLITHNLLKCGVKGLEDSQGYPLKIECVDMEVTPAEYNEDLVKNMIKRMKFEALKSACVDLSIGQAVVNLEEWDEEKITADKGLMSEIHHLLFEVHVQNGALICPTTGRRFPVKDGIPNMLLHEDEV
jgi:multifunctional methyltransferase subunit TRM112